MTKVLLLYGSRYGSTAEISEKIEEVIREQDVEVESINLEDTKLKELPPLQEFEGVLIGSGIRINSMTKSVKKFFKKYADALNKRENLVGVFVSCGTANNPEERPKARKDYIEKVLEKYGINADIYEAFGGMLDLTEESKLGFFSQKILKMVAKEDPTINLGERNDNRDWDLIAKFADDFCDLLKK